MKGVRSAGYLVAVLGVMSLAVLPACVSAQEERTDSTRARLLERLRVLGLPPGDSSMAVPDSALIRSRQEQARQGTATGSSAPQDVLSQLRALPGYSAAEYEGRSAEYRAGVGILYLYGDSTRPAVLLREGERLQADSVIRYDDEAQVVDARGAPVYTPSTGDEVRSEGIRVRLDREEASAVGAQTRYREGADWIVTGDLPVIQSELAYGHKTRFTSCELEVPHYHFEADQLKIVRGRILVARPVRLYFGDVPVAWLPFIAQSLAGGDRASGLLTPQFSVNDIVRTSGGYRRRISNLGYYWAMSQYSDASLALDWFDDNYTALTVETQYRWLRQFLNGRLSYRQFWRANGTVEKTLNTRHNWEISERTRFNMSAAWASSDRFVVRNSFDQDELTRSIDSQGGLNHRFDWGNLSLSANRKQFLEDRVEMTLPDVSLSLNTITLFPASVAQGGPLNNVTLSGGGNLRRATRDFVDSEPGRYDTGTLNGAARASIGFGRLSIGGDVTYREASTLGLPRDSLPFFPEAAIGQGLRAFQTLDGRLAAQEALTGERVDVSQATLDMSASVSFQQNLIGTTTLTPSVTLSRSATRADTSRYAQDFIAGPPRISAGATLRSDVYGFYPGFGGFERVRHKLTPSFTYSWAPEVEPNDVQTAVFGARTLQPRSVLGLSLSQTFEAKRAVRGDTAAAGESEAPGERVGEDGLRRVESGEVVTLLSLNTSAVEYDFVEADSSGGLFGFRTTRLTNTISSDYLRGLQIRMAHDLFDDERSEDPDVQGTRRFAPHLTQLNFGFTLNDRSTVVRLLGLTSRSRSETEDEDLPEDEGEGEGDAFEDELDAVDAERDPRGSMVPGPGDSPRGAGPRSGGAPGSWSANLTYTMNRPRSGDNTNQMVRATFSLHPTELWQMRWRTGYDIERREFGDHAISLVRDLHRWQANFDFIQTSNGNWRFAFEVRLLDNEDLHFDYQQRSDVGRDRPLGPPGS
jgi:hypothetical protein